eukprot:TRINITY_DN300_c0_g1_i1.p1 TRINITY_DN300_c0_g1~~TRINITY_DN300_c0_g1_i1.p1  ORF type:complete len:198 (-),score=37.30 TRINITY_DN300_c0_g1_i1:769-1362(-)
MEDTKLCSTCDKSKTKSNFTNSQWKKNASAIRTCCQCQESPTPSIALQVSTTQQTVAAHYVALLQENANLKAENHELMLQCQVQNHRLVRLEIENIDFKKQIEALQEENTQLKLENAKLKIAVQDLTIAIQDLQASSENREEAHKKAIQDLQANSEKVQKIEKKHTKKLFRIFKQTQKIKKLSSISKSKHFRKRIHN